MNVMTRDSDYFRRRAAEARAAACSREYGERAEIAGDLARAYAALERRRAQRAKGAEPQVVEETPAIPLEI
jgi:hypothetical protein